MNDLDRSVIIWAIGYLMGGIVVKILMLWKF